jgi:hypothetical protein
MHPRARGARLGARSFGNEGVVLMVRAERRGDAATAEAKLSQINPTFETMQMLPFASSARRFCCCGVPPHPGLCGAHRDGMGL